MPSSTAPPDDARRPVGRPARISRQAIAEAAHDVGLDGLTLRAVADRLDVSIAALYHHVSGKDELLRLAAEYSASRQPLPRDIGQHWAVWLYEWAAYNRDAFLTEPGLLTQYLEGAISAESIAARVETILANLVRQGFTILEANAAYELVSTCALGTVVATVRARRAAEQGTGLRDMHDARDAVDLAALPHVRALLEVTAAGGGRASFEAQVGTLLAGIAAERGEAWEEIVALLPAGSPADDADSLPRTFRGA